MIEQAMVRHTIDVSKSYVVGDQYLDIELAHRAGTGAVLVMTGPKSQDALAICQKKRLPVDFVAPRFSDAVSWILRQ